MVDATLNIPEVVREVSDHFERYERALVNNDVAVLDATFWDSPHTVRYAPNQRSYGFDTIHAHRMARTPSTKAGRIRLEILTIGRDFATVNLEYALNGREGTGVQSHSSVRFPDAGWKVVRGQDRIGESPR
jgi:hypothetical protein